MELQKFISDVLDQLQTIKTTDNKKYYLIDELVFEVTLTVGNEGQIGVAVFGIGGEILSNNQNTQRVTIKMKPKRNSK